MATSIRDRILDLLRKSEKALNSEEIASKLRLSKRQVQEANTSLKRQNKIKAQGKLPYKYVLNKDQFSPEEDSDFELINQYVILYMTRDSSLKMFDDIEDSKQLITKYEELYKLPDIITIVAYKKLEVVQKFELKG